MAPNFYKENHYVPRWYQERFLPATGQRVFRYLDLTPEQFRDPNGVLRIKTAIRKWGAPNCFKETDLYTVKYGNFESTDIEQFFFGKVDESGKEAVEFFSTYNSFEDVRTNPSESFHALLNYMSVQRFRTPKGLKYLSTFLRTDDKNHLLIEMQRLQNMHCAIWTECVWALVDATVPIRLTPTPTTSRFCGAVLSASRPRWADILWAQSEQCCGTLMLWTTPTHLVFSNVKILLKGVHHCVSAK